MDIVHAVVNGEVGRRTYRTTSLLAEERQTETIGTEIRILPAQILGSRFYENGTCAVAEDGTGGAVGIVNNAGHLVGTADHHLLVATALHKASGHIHGKEEAAAGCLHIHAVGILHAQTANDYAGGGGEMIVGCGRGQDKAIHLLRVCASLGQQLLDSLASHITSTEAFLVEDMALLDTDTGHNPFVVGIYHTRKFVIIQYVFGYITTHTGDYCIYLFHNRFGDNLDLQVGSPNILTKAAHPLDQKGENGRLITRLLSLCDCLTNYSATSSLTIANLPR